MEYKIPTCFVIIPFDERYGKRFDDIYKPALEKASFFPYRVDRDPSVEVPIQSIEKKIQEAAICLADITDDNPNVWYELGFAFAKKKSVIMLCSTDRDSKYPFDIQHRKVISYSTDSLSDFDDLRNNITNQASSLLETHMMTRKNSESESIMSQSQGISQEDLQVLALTAGESVSSGNEIYMSHLKETAEREGLTSVGFGLAIWRLKEKGLVKVNLSQDFNGDSYFSASISDEGWKWIDDNEKLFDLRKKGIPKITDEDIPF